MALTIWDDAMSARVDDEVGYQEEAGVRANRPWTYFQRYLYEISGIGRNLRTIWPEFQKEN
ncbi:hypothetical protein SRABI26_00378 [Arthrobacter sp. Bi26]|uniref:hypothetical protein n=1 Tax=Arthrobacter sp. Bi26 TaxID=2822350 RepID=UPI001D903060|nr:hypothetical protein [Arthrobacter sp. Bi26]CAH0136993.1 hypothetical protein SRABI26_00378 [Arthrobacter sp. Bi26]